MKKILTSILTLLLSFSVLQAQSDDPQLINITNLGQLRAIRYDLDGDGVADYSDGSGNAPYQAAFPGLATGSYNGYELMVNLDFNDASSYASNTINTSWTTGRGWFPIGDFNPVVDISSPFRAIFEGNGHTISNLYINRSSSNDLGLFGIVSGSNAELRNIGLLEVKVTGRGRVGGLVGSNEGGTVSGSYATGAVTGRGGVGGLVGSNDGDISNSYATGAVTGDDYVGGLVGYNSTGTVSTSYATGSVTGDAYVGGLVGLNYQGTVSNSYVTGSVTGDAYVGGLVGLNYQGTVSDSYVRGSVMGRRERVGGLVGENNGTITASYYNTETTGQSDTSKGEGKTTAELLTPTGYVGIYQTWNDGPDGVASNGDDTDYWDFGTNGQHPVLKLDVDGNGTVGEVADLLAQRPLRFTQTSYAFAILNTANINDVVSIVRAVPEDANNELTYSMGTSAEFSIRDVELRRIILPRWVKLA